MRRVVVLRGTTANPWDLRPWEELADDFDVTVLLAANNEFDISGVPLRQVPIRTVGALLEPGRLAGRLALKGIGERYLSLGPALAGAEIVHAAELGNWYAAHAATLRRRLGFRLAITVWETLPFLNAYRNVRTRPYRQRVLREADVFLPATERARTALTLEGVTPGRIRVAPPCVSLDAYEAARNPPSGTGHLVLSIGRLVWEKGHQDVLRAVALMRARGRSNVRVMIVGNGPEEHRLRRVTADLGLADVVEMRRWVPHHELPAVYASASCLVLASQPTRFWEEQFGMVLIEAMAAHVPVVASASGAIPEVVGDTARLFVPGDWVGLADALEQGPLSGPSPVRRAPPPEQLERYSAHAAAERLRSVYDELLSGSL
jgi:glycosyltransferase involved in cell wall biosynthesis